MTSVDKEFVLERYRYILEQKKFLNKTTFVVISTYQAGLALVIAANYQLWVAFADKKLSKVFVSIATGGLMLLLWAIALFSISILVSGLVSWLGYRNDEASIEMRYLGGSRPLPGANRVFHWYETYVVLGILVVTIGFSWFFSFLHSRF